MHICLVQDDANTSSPRRRWTGMVAQRKQDRPLIQPVTSAELLRLLGNLSFRIVTANLTSCSRKDS